MSENQDDPAAKSPAEKLAALVAQRKAAVGQGQGGFPGKRQSERGAAAYSASRSKPAMKK